MTAAGTAIDLLRLSRSARLPPERLRALQNRRLQHLVAHAYATVPYYRRLLDRIGATPGDIRCVDDLVHLPVTTRSDLLAQPVRDVLSTAFSDDEMIAIHTHGSTGIPLRVRLDRQHFLHRRALFLRALLAGTYRLGQRLMLVTDRPKKPMPRWLNWHYVSRDDPFELMRSEFLRIRPRFLYGWATLLRQIAEGVQGTPFPRLAGIYTTAETVEPATRRLLEGVFGAPVFDIYGSNELGPVAWQCRAHAGHHISEESTILELVPVPGSEAGRVVATSLGNLAMPLIRYDTADLARAGEAAACACGRTLRRLAGIEGRSVDTVVTRDGRRISPWYFTDRIEVLPGMRRFQVVQSGIDQFVVRAQVAPDAPPDIAERIVTAVRGIVGEPAAVTVEFAAQIDPPPGRKFRAVESRVGGGAGA